MKLGCCAGAPRVGSVPGLCLVQPSKALGQTLHPWGCVLGFWERLCLQDCLAARAGASAQLSSGPSCPMGLTLYA